MAAAKQQKKRKAGKEESYNNHSLSTPDTRVNSRNKLKDES